MSGEIKLELSMKELTSVVKCLRDWRESEQHDVYIKLRDVLIDEIAKDEEEETCQLCDYCAKHQIHSGKGHNYTFDSCWKCEDEIKEKDV